MADLNRYCVRDAQGNHCEFQAESVAIEKVAGIDGYLCGYTGGVVTVYFAPGWQGVALRGAVVSFQAKEGK